MAETPTQSSAASAANGTERITPTGRRVIVLLFTVLFLDGYDTTSLGFVVPSLAGEWGLPPASFTPALVATNAGVVIGYLLCGALAARFGRRNAIVAGTAIFAVGSPLTVLAHGIPQLTAVRLVTALGLGIVLPTSISLAADHAPRHRRDMVTVGVTLALSVGAMAGGLLGGRLIAGFGWTSVFWLGAALPLIMLPALYWGLPRSDEDTSPMPSDRRSPRVSVSTLLSHGSATNTILLWAFAFLAFTTTFALQAWLPTLLTTGYGLAPAQAPLGSAVLGFGGVTGGILLAVLAARFGIPRCLMGSVLVGALFLIVASQLSSAGTALFLTLAVAGAGITGGVIGQAALAVTLYEPAVRTQGIAWAAAFGRAGSVAGPAAAGALLAAGLTGQKVILLTVVPIGLAVAVALTIAMRHGRPAADPPTRDA
ncbi:MFS transporter [Streptomyces flavidovirens]|uniref:MFS transporter n=1 Tax=Streptomyces flavidovirens TaxID=67298 RepID=UPI0004222992|nr:MFS transporter [Streptomyces flavidovirens]